MRKAAACRIVFDGQSLVNSPGFRTGDPIFGWAWSRLVIAGRGLPAYNVAVGGTSLTSLHSTFASRAAPWIAPGSLEPTIYVLCGGFTDINSEGDTGAQVYADAGVLADDARAAGAQYVICTTVFPSTVIVGSEETARTTANSLILADASNKFDAQIDFEVSGLNDPTDTESYFVDGVHIYGFPASSGRGVAKGTPRAAAVAAPAIDAAIAAVTP